MANIRDIAEACNMSVATVSRYINKKGNVSQTAGEKIEAAIRKFNYAPNEHARAIFKQKSHIIGLVFPDFFNPYFGEMATILGQLLQNSVYRTILCFTEDNPEKELNALKTLMGYKVDGIFICRATCHDYIERLDIPVVSFETPIEHVINVSADNYAGGRLAFDVLYKKGRRRLAHLRGPVEFAATEDRYRGFKDAAREMGLDIDEIPMEMKLVDAIQVQAQLANYDLTKYDGFFAFNDMCASYLVEHLKRLGLRLPQDVSVIGFDNSYLSKFISPPLTTIEQSIYEVSTHCYELLMEAIQHHTNDTRHEVIPVHLIERQSV